MDKARAMQQAAEVLLTLKGATWEVTVTSAPKPSLCQTKANGPMVKSNQTKALPTSKTLIPHHPTSSTNSITKRPSHLNLPQLPLPSLTQRILPLPVPKPHTFRPIPTHADTSPTLPLKRRTPDSAGPPNTRRAPAPTLSDDPPHEGSSSLPACSDTSDTHSTHDVDSQQLRQKRQRRPCSRYSSKDYETAAAARAAAAAAALTATSCVKAEDDVSSKAPSSKSHTHHPHPSGGIQGHHHKHGAPGMQVPTTPDIAAPDRKLVQKLPRSCAPLLSALVSSTKLPLPAGFTGHPLKAPLLTRPGLGHLGALRRSSSTGSVSGSVNGGEAGGHQRGRLLGSLMVNGMRSSSSSHDVLGLQAKLPAKSQVGLDLQSEIRVSRKPICAEVH